MTQVGLALDKGIFAFGKILQSGFEGGVLRFSFGVLQIIAGERRERRAVLRYAPYRGRVRSYARGKTARRTLRRGRGYGRSARVANRDVRYVRA